MDSIADWRLAGQRLALVSQCRCECRLQFLNLLALVHDAARQRQRRRLQQRGDRGELLLVELRELLLVELLLGWGDAQLPLAAPPPSSGASPAPFVSQPEGARS